MKALVSVAFALASCKGTDTKTEPGRGTPTEVAPAPPPVDSAPPVTPDAAAAPAVNGAFASIEAWCEDKARTFDPATCDNECSCERADRWPRELTGTLVATGTSAAIQFATIVRVTEGASQKAHCGIAAQTPDGWRVFEKAFVCGNAPNRPVEGDMTGASVDTFTVSDQGLELSALTDVSRMTMDPGGHATTRTVKQTPVKLRCKVEGTKLACKPRQGAGSK